jgi:phosphate transport system permease protein
MFSSEAPRLDLVDDQRPSRPATPATGQDLIFRMVCLGAAMVTLVIVVVTMVFLVEKSRPAFQASGYVGFFKHSYWLPNLTELSHGHTVFTARFGVLGLLENTVLIAFVALVVGVPTALAMALFINEYAPKRVSRFLTGAVDLLASVPSIIFGIWAIFCLESPTLRLSTFFADHFSVFPFFRTSPTARFGGSTFEAGLVVGVMIVPIVTSISRDVMSQVPREQCEGALALGGTRWGMIRDVILPFGRSGIIGAAILGLGRALGETIAILFIVSQTYALNTHILTQGSGSIASTIANLFEGESNLARSGLVAAGLTLFILTFLVNLAARVIVTRTGRFK